MSVGSVEQRAQDLAFKLRRAGSKVHFGYLTVAARQAIANDQPLRDSVLSKEGRRLEVSAGRAIFSHASKRNNQQLADEVRRDYSLGELP